MPLQTTFPGSLPIIEHFGAKRPCLVPSRRKALEALDQIALELENKDLSPSLRENLETLYCFIETH